MILMGENPFRGPLKGVGPESRLFLALKWQRAKQVPFGIKKSRKQVHWSFYVQEFCCRCILYSVFCTACCEFMWFSGPTLSKNPPPCTSLPYPLPTGTKWIHFVPRLPLATPSLPHRDKVNSLRPGRGGRGRGGGLFLLPSPPSPFVGTS